MEKFKDTGFERAEIVRNLFNRCTLDELLVIEQRALRGEFKQHAVNQPNSSNEHSDGMSVLNNKDKCDLAIDFNCLI